MDEAQIGLTRTASDESLAGTADGDWQPTWLVIAYDAGDPVFVDTAQAQFPVLTAAHGQAEWEPMLISSSLQGLTNVLDVLERASIGRQHPEAPRANPLWADEVSDLLARIHVLAAADSSYWDIWFEQCRW